MEDTDGHSDHSYEMVDYNSAEMEDSDDHSFEMVDSENSFYGMTDSEEEDSSAGSELQTSEIESSGFNTDDVSDMFGRIQFETVAHRKADDNVFGFPAHFKRKEDMKIKDVVMDHALPFLPAKSLVQFRTVSKEWDRWITSPFLAHKQSYCFRETSGFFSQYGHSDPTFVTLNQSAYGIPDPSLSFLPELVVIRSSCNGLLLCQGRGGENVYYICNPVNKEWKVLPQPNYYHGSQPAIVLAFEPSVLNMEAHYQLICAVPVIDQPILYFEIYSSVTRSWKCSAVDCIELEASRLKDSGFYMKGVVYWETLSGKVLAFDMKNEFYGILPLPSDSTPRGVLTQIHGELCYIHVRYEAGNAYVIDIYGGINMSLRHSIAVDVELVGDEIRVCRVLPCDNSDMVMVLINGAVYSYHVRGQKFEAISRAGNDSRARYFPHVNSLVSMACN